MPRGFDQVLRVEDPKKTLGFQGQNVAVFIHNQSIIDNFLDLQSQGVEIRWAIRLRSYYADGRSIGFPWVWRGTGMPIGIWNPKLAKTLITGRRV